MEDDHALLRAEIFACTRCRLSDVRLGAGAVPPYIGPGYEVGGLMLISERPGPDEGDQQEPMVGRAGQLLNRLLHRADISRQDCVISNRVRCRPPEDRLDEIPEALFACDWWTGEEVRRLQPRVVVLVGGIAIQGIFGPEAKVGQFRHKAREHGEHGVTYVATYHPAHALRHRHVETLIVEDLVLAKELL